VFGTGGASGGAGIRGTGGGTGAGVIGFGGTGGGFGVSGFGTGTTGIGVVGSGSQSGDGVYGLGGSTSGNGVRGSGGAPNGNGVAGSGTGLGNGLSGTGGSGGGAGVLGNGGTGAGGVVGSGGASSGDGVNGTGGSPNGSGVVGTGAGTGPGVLAISPSGPYAIKAQGNASQGASDKGWLKAAASVKVSGITPTISACYNSQALSSPTVAPCGFTVTRNAAGDYTVDFGFSTEGQFFSVVPLASGTTQILTTNLIIPGGGTQAEVFLTTFTGTGPITIVGSDTSFQILMF